MRLSEVQDKMLRIHRSKLRTLERRWERAHEDELNAVEQYDLLAAEPEPNANEILLDESAEWEGKNLTVEQRRERLVGLR